MCCQNKIDKAHPRRSATPSRPLSAFIKCNTQQELGLAKRQDRVLCLCVCECVEIRPGSSSCRFKNIEPLTDGRSIECASHSRAHQVTTCTAPLNPFNVLTTRHFNKLKSSRWCCVQARRQKEICRSRLGAADAKGFFHNREVVV